MQAMQTENVHRRSDEPFWRKVPSRMTGNSSNFTDANRRVSQPGLRLSGRGADRAMMIEAVIGGLNHGVGRGNERMALCCTEAAILKTSDKHLIGPAHFPALVQAPVVRGRKIKQNV